MLSIQRARRRVSRGHLAAGLILGLGLTMSLTQCRMVSDSVTGVKLTPATTLSKRNSCTRQCNDAFKAAERDEERRHRAAKRACHSDHACRKAEEALHQSNLAAIARDRRNCKSGCYNEGGGKGGHDHDD